MKLIAFFVLSFASINAFDENNFFNYDDFQIKPVDSDSKSFTIYYERDKKVINFSNVKMKDINDVYESRLIPFDYKHRLIFVYLPADKFLTYNVDTLEGKDVNNVYNPNGKIMPNFFNTSLLLYFGSNLDQGLVQIISFIYVPAANSSAIYIQKVLEANFERGQSWQFVGAFLWKNQIYHVFQGKDYLTILRQKNNSDFMDLPKVFSAILMEKKASRYAFLPSNFGPYFLYYNRTTIFINNLDPILTRLTKEETSCQLINRPLTAFDFEKTITNSGGIHRCNNKSITLIKQQNPDGMIQLTDPIKEVFPYQLSAPENVIQIAVRSEDGNIACYDRDLKLIGPNDCVLGKALATVNGSKSFPLIKFEHLNFNNETCEIIAPFRDGDLMALHRVKAFDCVKSFNPFSSRSTLNYIIFSILSIIFVSTAVYIIHRNFLSPQTELSSTPKSGEVNINLPKRPATGLTPPHLEDAKSSGIPAKLPSTLSGYNVYSKSSEDTSFAKLMRQKGSKKPSRKSARK